MKRKSNNIVSWLNVVVALIFLFNPNIGLVDILPDCIGYVLLVLALSRVAVIDERIESAHALFIRLIYITLVRFALLFITFSVIPLTDRSTSMLLFSFVCDVLELITLVPALIKLFDGVLYLAERHNGDAVYLRFKRTNKTVTERVRNTAIVFAMAKAVFGTLPEFSSLSAHEGWNESIWARMHYYIGMFRIIGILVSLIFGIIFLCSALKYVRLLKKDAEFFDRLYTVYESEIATRPDYLARRAASVAFGFFVAASVFIVDFSLDGYNVIPDVLAAICLIAGLLVMRKYINNWKLPAIVATMYGVVSLVGIVLEYIFASKYYIDAIDVDPETYNFFVVVCVLCVLSSVIFASTMIITVKGTLAEIIDKYTGFSMTTNDTYDPSDKVKQLHIALKRRTTILIVLSVLSAMLSIAAKLLVTTIGFLWMISIVADVVYAVFTFKILAEIKDQIDYKYMLS